MGIHVGNKHNDQLGLWMFIAVIIITTAVFLWTSAHYQRDNASLDTHVDAQGQLHVLGITLAQTSLKQAENILQSKSDVALYIYPQKHEKEGRKLEAFFPAIADHTKVILLLDMSRQNLDLLESDATIPHLYPNNVVRMNLAADDRRGLDQAIVRELTLIPSVVVSAENLKARFGEPDLVESMPTYAVYHYKSIGLQARLNKQEPPSLHFRNPTKMP
ncbi:MAG: hypothetical protein Q9M20_08285 [Mariprofundaceae bacterium]|nr:hypothetical protein [Mariprofundaceae bacterium]